MSNVKYTKQVILNKYFSSTRLTNLINIMSFIINSIKSLLHRMLQLFWFGKKTISNSLNIYIKTNTGNTLAVDLNPEWDIKNVKEHVAPKLGLLPEEVKIIFAGKELSDSITLAVRSMFANCDFSYVVAFSGMRFGSTERFARC